jgi:TonB family protein
MSRLLKKCLFLSIGLHILLAAALLICTAFFIAKPEKIMPTLSMIAPDVLDNLLNPQPVSTPKKNPNPPVRRIVTPAPPKKVTPTPPKKVTPTPPKKVTPTPPKKVTPKKQTPSVKPTKSKTIKIAQNTQTSKGATVRPKKNTHPKAPPVSAKQLNTIKSMRNQLSAAINVNVAGANAAAFTSYANFVVGVYRRTWEPLIPSGLARSRIAKVSVTIRRDGRVLSAKIISKTGDAALDRSVQRALDRVKTIGKPFPSGSKGSQRTFTLDFTPRIRG